MLKNHIKIAFRSIWRNRAFSAINISGLAIAIASVILIGLWIHNEWNFDKFHAKDKDLYKVWNRYQSADGNIGVWDITSAPIGEALVNEFPEVINSAKIHWSDERLFSFGDKNIKTQGNEVGKSFLSMFSFPLIQGDKEHALDDLNAIVITQSFAKKIFGDVDPMNQILKVDNKESYKVTGVLKDLPSNTTFDFDYLIQLDLHETKNEWGTQSYYTYIELQPNTSIEAFNEKIKDLVIKSSSYKWEVFLYPFSKSHLYGHFENGVETGGRIQTLRLMLLIGGLVLLIACINFMNLSTAQSQKRGKEVGVRKVLGARKSSLITQFLFESILLTFIAAILALLLAAISLPFFNQLLDSSLVINYANPFLWIGLLIFIVFTGLLAGGYPAFLLSSFTPFKVLKGSYKTVWSLFDLRKTLVVVQFSVGIVLVIATIIVYQQIDYVQNRDLGYEIDNLVEIPIEGDINKNFSLIKNELIQSGAVSSMSKTGWRVTLDASNSSGIEWDGMNKEEEPISFSIYRTGGDFAKTMNLKIMQGRDLDLSLFPNDTSSVMLNKKALEQMGFEDPIGKLISWGENTTYTIVGVVDDFIISNPYEEVSPLIIFGFERYTYNSLLRLNNKNSTATNLKIVEDVFKKYNPAYPFTYKFTDQAYASKFKEEKQIGELSTLFAGLSIFISCLGLFGLTAFTAEQRKKEIGVRKVLGASVSGIVRLLSQDFIKLVVLSILIATPIAWYFMDGWLQGFTYRIGISFWVFLLAGLIAISIALITTCFHTIKAARANPVKSLRAE